MKINTRALIMGSALVLAAVAGVFLFCATQGKYAFVGEPQLLRDRVTLEQKPLESREPLTDLFFRERLDTDVQKQAYDTLSEFVMDADESQIPLEGADKDDLQMAVNAFRCDHPEVFWLDPESGYQYYDDGESVTAEFRYTQTGDELWAEREALEEAVKKVIAAAPDNASDYEMELYLNDYLADNCDYNDAGANRHSAYGALVDGQAVCDGYSHAFQLLCRRLGIECTVVEGGSDFNDDSDNGHMWNCILLGESWYHIDVTWNDAPNALCEAERYFYCNLTDEQIARDHLISGGYAQRSDNPGNYFNIFVPVCDCDDLNYMRLNYAVVGDPEDDGQMVASLIDAAKNKKSCCAFLIGGSEDFETVVQSITREYASAWIQGANQYLQGDARIDGSGKLITYESKRVLVIVLE